MRPEDEREMFAPANGIRARWRYAYDLVAACEPDDSITLEQLAEALDIYYQPGDDHTRSLLFQVMDTARTRLEEDGMRTVQTQEKYGWIVLDSSGALRQSVRRMRKVQSAAARTATSLGAIRREELSQQERQENDFLTSNVLRVGDAAGGRRKPVFRELHRKNQQRKEIEGR